MTLTAFSGRKPSQNEFELRSFIDLLNHYGVKSYLEVGAREGDTFVEIMQSLPKGSKGVAVDLPGGLWGKKSTAKKLPEAINHLQKNGYNVSALFGNSQETATKRIVVGRGPYDAILIDGDHTLLGVSRDFDNYHHLAPIIAFHDIVGTGQVERVFNNPVEVPIFWQSLKVNYASTYEFVEFVDDGSAMGIGVMIKKQEQ